MVTFAEMGIATDLVEPITKDGIRRSIRHIHDCIAKDKPIVGMYKEFLLDALDKIAKGSNPDTAFKFRPHQTNPSSERKIMDAMREIYDRNTKGTKITKIIDEVASEFGFGYEVLKAEWYKDKKAWKRTWDDYYEDQRIFYTEKLSEYQNSAK